VSFQKNPSSKYPGHLTVAENGKKANIYIYKFPEMNLISLLKKGATCQYTLVDYSADGELLGSQGGFPDYTITIWDWKRQEIKLRAKSFGNDVLNIFFSPWVPEQLTTCGIGHVKFWRMSDTFTGLKLQGVPGRFGKTEICNILGVYSMPDEKVLSGCEWGNILVWDEGLIKFEVCRKNRKPCHVGQITQISMHGEEVTTVGTDGFIRVWFWETVELADPPEDDLFVEIEPVLEYKIGNAELLKITSNDAGDKWFGQDGNGGIWKFTMSQENPSIPEQVFRCHSGEIVGLGVSPQSHHIATLAETGHLHVYDYQKRSMIFHHQFVAPGRDVIWVPTTVDSSGHILILGFGDGITRVVALNLLANGSGEYVQLIQAIKCHRLGITKLSLNPTGNLLVSGAEDATIFIYRISKENPPYIRLVPIGFVKVPDIVTCITWNPKFSSSLIVGCQHGQVSEISILNTEEFQQKFTYLLDNVEVKSLTFKSTKSQMKRDLKLREIEERRAVRRKEKKKEFERLQIEDPMMNMTEEEFLGELFT
jgi:WD40 repeat protein